MAVSPDDFGGFSAQNTEIFGWYHEDWKQERWVHALCIGEDVRSGQVGVNCWALLRPVMVLLSAIMGET
ncbi:MAG: hypothetical protein H6629_02805 [Calditrichae bacterium]|nr:hypothetical protein [Calditrichia bacterium]